MNKKGGTIQPKKYTREFNIDLSQETMGAVFEVMSLDGHKFKVELVDPRLQIVRVVGVGNDGNDIYNEPCEGNITTTRGRISRLTAYASLPVPKGTNFAIMIEKLRRF